MAIRNLGKKNEYPVTEFPLDVRYAPFLRLTDVSFSNIGRTSVGLVGGGLLYPLIRRCRFIGKGRGIDFGVGHGASRRDSDGKIVKLGSYYGANVGHIVDSQFTCGGGSVLGGYLTVERCGFESQFWDYTRPLPDGTAPVALVDTRDFLANGTSKSNPFTMRDCYFELHVNIDSGDFDPEAPPLVALNVVAGRATIENCSFFGQTPIGGEHGRYHPGSTAIRFQTSAGAIRDCAFTRWETGVRIVQPNERRAGIEIGIGNRFLRVKNDYTLHRGFPGLVSVDGNEGVNPQNFYIPGIGSGVAKSSTRDSELSTSKNYIDLSLANVFCISSDIIEVRGAKWPTGHKPGLPSSFRVRFLEDGVRLNGPAFGLDVDWYVGAKDEVLSFQAFGDGKVLRAQ